jgi:fructuronate reductase
MRDPELVALIRRIGYVEGLPVVTDPGILSPRAFIDEVVEKRLPNPFMPDTPQRIATDTSQKLAIRFGETVKAYLASDTLDVQSLRLIPLVYAGWLRYLQGTDDEGRPMTLSPDPLLEKVCPMVKAGETGALLRDEAIFGLDLEKAGLAGKVKKIYGQLCEGPGSVRSVLHETVAQTR